MAEEEVVVAAPSPVPSDHKRKLDEIDLQAPAVDRTHDSDEEDNDVTPADSSDVKRPRLDDEKIDGLASENGHEAVKSNEPAKLDEEEDPQKIEVNEQSEENDSAAKEAEETVKLEQVEGTTEEMDQQLTDKIETADAELAKVESFKAPNGQEPAEVVNKEPSDELHQQEVDDGSTITRRMEVPNAKVGVLIGKAGDTIRYLQYNSGAKIQIMRDADADRDTIRYLQYNSGAKIQIMRDADADRDATTRPVEIIGILSSILKAEKLIDAVIAEADAGGSPSLVARGLATSQAAGAADQIEIQVPNEKVGLIIGRGGETIKGLQTRSGARIQLIPQHLPEGDGSKERTVRVTGDKKQIDMAKEMIKEVMNQILGTFSMGSALLSWCSNRQPLSPFIH